jgi:hypothetical protein
LRPPDDLDELERREFVSLIVGSPPSHFVPSDLPLIAAYAKAIVAERIAAGELAAAPVVSSPNGDRPSPWLAVWQARVRSLATLARMLSLSPGGRVASKSADEPQISYYERMAMERRDEPDPN